MNVLLISISSPFTSLLFKTYGNGITLPHKNQIIAAAPPVFIDLSIVDAQSIQKKNHVASRQLFPTHPNWLASLKLSTCITNFWNSRRKWRYRPKSLLTYETVILRSCPFFPKWKFKLIFLAVKNNVFVSTIYFQVSEIIVNSKPSMHHVDKMRWYSWTQLAMGACVWDVAWPEIMGTLDAQQMSWMKWISDAQEEDNAISTFLLWETLFNHVQRILPPI